jgi:2,7-dihydroxy-5-methyl-1-naphthoate 7-O-methyltransferase
MPEPVNLAALSDLCTPWCVHVVATLRIAERIAEGTANIADLAAAAGCDADVLHAVLTHLVSKGVFLEPSFGQFALNEPAHELLEPVRQLTLDLDGIGGRMAYAWGTLLSLVRTGKPAYHQVFGRPFWEDLDANPNIAASFDTLIGPAGHGDPNPDFQISGGWEGIRTIVDVGGGTGAMLAQLLRTRPTIHGTLVDLPRTVARSNVIFDPAGVADRVTIVGQSFFEPLPPGADIYLLRGILNDWPDQEAQTILKRCAEATRPNGRVVVLKGIVPDQTPRAIEIEMVLLGGKQRSVAAFRKLARAAGLELVSAEKQASGYFVAELHPIE